MRRIALAVIALLAVVERSSADDSIALAEGPVSVGPGLEIDVRHGEPRPVIDGIGWVIGVPSKLMLLDARADNHDVSAATVAGATDLLAAKEVDGVMVRVNQYDPLGEWRRLAKNDRVSLPWRATVGTLYTLGYSVLPGRLIGGDWYNPFTDTVHVYSDVPALAMEQAAQAYDSHQKSHPGLYSAVRLLPLVGLVHEARSKEVVFEHLDESGSVEEQAEARRVLQPQLGREVGGQAAMLLPQADALFSLGGAAVGHVVGRYQANRIEAAAEDEAVTPSSTAPASVTPPDSPTLGTPLQETLLP